MAMTDQGEVTSLLHRWADGDEAALEALTPLIYDELRIIAGQVFRRESPAHTLQPTALVHEAYERLVGVDVDWRDSTHFFALAARMMRRLLVNHAKARNTAKRGGGELRVTLDEARHGGSAEDQDVLDVDQAISTLADLDERKARLLELHYFAGFTQDQAATALSVSEATCRRDLRLAKAWMRKFLGEREHVPE